MMSKQRRAKEKQGRDRPPELDFNQEFKRAWDLIAKTNQNVLITGRAGTGKSTFLNLLRQGLDKPMAVLAPTGVAAVNINGVTIHSFFGFNPGITLEKAARLGHRARSQGIYGELKLLIIDEISMVRADLLDCCDAFLRPARGSRLPLGGVQAVFIGDLYQLPPVLRSQEQQPFQQHYASPYFFEARVMAECEGRPGRRFELVEFEKIYRQSDPVFIDILNAIRNRTITDEQLEMLNQCVGPRPQDKDAIVLTSLNRQADEINLREMERLPGRSRNYTGQMEGEFAEGDLPTDLKLTLKAGSRVMLLNNDRRGRWINGTLGTVTRLGAASVRVALDEGGAFEIEPFTWEMFQAGYDSRKRKIVMDTVGRFTQLPLRPAWAVTIHKAQGKTFDRVVIDVGRGTFAAGQAYVALSRCRSLQGITLARPLKRGHILIDYRISKFLTGFQYQQAEREQPLEKKVELINRCLEKRRRLFITYLKAKDEKSRREILPLRLEEMEYSGHRYLGLEAFCYARGEKRIFNVARILEAREADVESNE